MHSLYVFDFLTTVSLQLKEKLEGLDETILNKKSLSELAQYQRENDSQHGVYVIHYGGVPKYVGKANNVSDRLGQHLTKLSGRKGIDLDLIGYKTLLLDKSMSTAANEDILISMFKQEHQDMWNGGGFGPKDPGKERDTTKPGPFDQAYPIIDEYPIELKTDESGAIKLRDVVSTMKEQLPYVFRYNIPAEALERTIVLGGEDRRARSLLKVIVSFLGSGWKGAIISYGMVLYETSKHYPHGEEINP
ncbi:hypothetical protein [Duganella sp. BuS-21]|uniref:hypothetical protein n=1 Tax=Duganella sp. BuS-21 TaxID=2943848 RepID=UPI0035A72AEE